MESLIDFFRLALPTHLVKVLPRSVSVVPGVLHNLRVKQVLNRFLGRQRMGGLVGGLR